MDEKKHCITCVYIDGDEIAVHTKEVKNRPEHLNWKKATDCKRKIKALIALLNSMCFEVSQDAVNEIIEYFNSKFGKNLKPSTDSYKKLIQARLNEGYTVEDFKKVIDNKATDWEGNAKMAKNLKPSTLFRACHFDEYLNGVTAVNKNKLKSKPSYDLEQIKKDAMLNTEI